ncbi:MAG: carbohydrate-binding protein [Oscillospiraceae bacterium]|nr:carbohydrate-binding protein [Oscillospiraceae bacterium]
MLSIAAAAALLGTVCGSFPLTVSAAETGFVGDLDGNQKLNSVDLSVMKHMLIADQSFSVLQQLQADVNADGSVTVADAVMLAKYLLTEITEFPAGVTVTVPDITFQERLYAVDAECYDGWEETDNTGFTGRAYWNYNNVIGSYVNWTVDVPADGNYAVTFRYANGGDANDSRTCRVTVNGGSESVSVDYPYTGNWTTWSETTVVLALKKGYNTIKATAAGSGGGPNMDYIELEQTNEPAAEMQKEPEPGALRVENLNRGVIASATANGMLINWRILGEDDGNTRFELYKNGQKPAIYTGTVKDASCYLDASGKTSDSYTVDVYQGDICTEYACQAQVLSSYESGAYHSGAYFDIPMTPPAGGTTPDGVAYTYSPNDCSVGDIDGDGQYELFVKWDPSNSHDNADAGYTGPVVIDCCRLSGERVWRINLGINIRAGAHYTQFMVYDFDGDNCAELICKTADGTTDGKGTVIGNANADYRDSTQMKLRDGSYAPSGRIISGPEYLTLFDGKTGAALDTVEYVPGRGTVGDWGDTWGNRCDRFTGCVAYLGGTGENASAVFGRGYYTRLTAAAWDVKNKKLVQRWFFDTGNNKSSAGYGDGNHQQMAADVDGDGKQEIICGSAVIDDNGKLLYTTSNAHGDAMHIGDFDPSNPGLEIFQCLEDSVHPNGKSVNFGIELRDAKTGKALFRETASGDTGRCLADNLIAGNSGAELVGSHSGNVYLASGNHGVVCQWSDITKWGQNSVVYWDGDLEREVLDRTMIDKYGVGRLFTGTGVGYNNYSKSNACLTCDLFGDWREEMIFPLGDGSGVRVYSTTFDTDYGIVSLMHNPQYRVQAAAQNNGYNQPPHLDYFLGTGFDIPANPAVYTTK